MRIFRCGVAFANFSNSGHAGVLGELPKNTCSTVVVLMYMEQCPPAMRAASLAFADRWESQFGDA